MSHTLRLRIDKDWPIARADLEWVLFDSRGSMLQRGTSEPHNWPAADACELVLCADQCLAISVKLPKGGKARGSELIAYALEERLAGDVEAEHFVAGDEHANGDTPVWVIRRTRLNDILTRLRQLDRIAARLFCELQLAPLAAQAWSVCLVKGASFARTGVNAGFALDVAQGEAPVALQLALLETAKSENAPQLINVFCERGVEFDPANWQKALGVPVMRAGDYDWTGLATDGACNLLSGEFVVHDKNASVFTLFRSAMALGLALLCLYSVFSFGQWATLQRQASHLISQKFEVFRATFPNVQTVIDPSLQMQRLYDQQKREQGQLGEGDFLALLAVIAQTPVGPLPYRNLIYEDGRLEFTVSLANAARAGELQSALASRGLSATLRGTRPVGSGIDVTISVRHGL